MYFMYVRTHDEKLAVLWTGCTASVTCIRLSCSSARDRQGSIPAKKELGVDGRWCWWLAKMRPQPSLERVALWAVELDHTRMCRQHGRTIGSRQDSYQIPVIPLRSALQKIGAVIVVVAAHDAQPKVGCRL